MASHCFLNNYAKLFYHILQDPVASGVRLHSMFLVPCCRQNDLSEPQMPVFLLPAPPLAPNSQVSSSTSLMPPVPTSTRHWSRNPLPPDSSLERSPWCASQFIITVSTVVWILPEDSKARIRKQVVYLVDDPRKGKWDRKGKAAQKENLAQQVTTMSNWASSCWGTNMEHTPLIPS